MWVRQAAGYAIITAGTGLAAISGLLAYHGFEAMISIPFAGWIGPCVAASCIGLGIAVESEIRYRRWTGAAILGVILISAGLLDRHSGELALKAKVTVAEKSNAAKLTAFTVASKAKADAEKLVSDLEAELDLMSGDDIKGAQLRLAALGLYAGPIDGVRGTITLRAMQARGEETRAQLAEARLDVRKHTDTVSAGDSQLDPPFTVEDAELYASLVTLLSIILAFAGSYVAHGVQRNPDDELSEMEAQATDLETEVFDLAAFLHNRNEAA